MKINVFGLLFLLSFSPICFSADTNLLLNMQPESYTVIGMTQNTPSNVTDGIYYIYQTNTSIFGALASQSTAYLQMTYSFSKKVALSRIDFQYISAGFTYPGSGSASVEIYSGGSWTTVLSGGLTPITATILTNLNSYSGVQKIRLTVQASGGTYIDDALCGELQAVGHYMSDNYSVII